MKILSTRKMMCVLAAAGLGSLGIGCISAQDASALAATDTGSATATTSASTDSSSTATSAAQSNLSDTELQLLQTVLSGLTSGSTSGSSSTTTSGATSLSDLKKLGLHKRDIAILALDVAAQQSNLTTEQTFGLQVAKALLSGDSNTLVQLLLQQVLSATSSDSTASTSQGTTL